MKSRNLINVCMLTLGVIVFSLPLPGWAVELTRDNAAKPIVFLSVTVPDKVTYQGKEYEIWLREPKGTSNNPIQKTHTESGTGFIVGDQNETYLVTAKHIAQNTSIAWSATISGPNDCAVSFRFPEFTGFTNKLPWVEHPVADVAVLRLKEDSKFSMSGMRSRFDISVLVSELKAPPREMVLTMIGFPLALGIGQKISPLTKESKAASGLYEIPTDTNTTTVFFLSDPSIEGYSGSPVFAFPTKLVTSYGGPILEVSEPSRCHGLISATLSDRTGGKLAQVVPSSQICETILLAHEQDKKKKDDDQPNKQ